ncbi:YheT family hydrolase [Singulisphaera rosea]
MSQVPGCPVSPLIPRFDPHPWIRGGHAQTIVSRYLPGRKIDLPSTIHEVEIDEENRLVVLESVPEDWRPGRPVAILVHGLAGNADAPYVIRQSTRLFALGIRIVRMNLRGAGLGFGRARSFYHAGQTEDLRRVSDWLTQRVPGSPLALLGFSLGANLVLKLASEATTVPLDGLDCVLAANPPLDLMACCRHLQRRQNRIYDRNFVRLLHAEVGRLHGAFPDLGEIDLSRAGTLYDFDDIYTAPRNGFEGADDYYEKSSSGPHLSRIQIPGLVVHAEDDPFIPVEPFRLAKFPEGLALELIPNGGHLGYFSRNRWDGDRRWLEARLATWLATHWGVG